MGKLSNSEAYVLGVLSGREPTGAGASDEVLARMADRGLIVILDRAPFLVITDAGRAALAERKG